MNLVSCPYFLFGGALYEPIKKSVHIGRAMRCSTLFRPCGRPLEVGHLLSLTHIGVLWKIALQLISLTVFSSIIFNFYLQISLIFIQFQHVITYCISGNYKYVAVPLYFATVYYSIRQYASNNNCYRYEFCLICLNKSV